MEVQTHQVNETRIAEVRSDAKIINSIEDGINLLGDLYYQGFDGIMLHQKDIVSDFFNLKTGMAGELLQKFSNYRVRLVIIGDFSRYSSKAFQDFVYESNKHRQINFVGSSAEAIEVLSK